MSRRDLWREGEVRVISVTPVSQGVLRPFLITLTTLAIIIEAAGRYSIIHRVEEWLVILLVLPLAVVTLTRTWRWRSHKLHVTNDRVIIEGGVLRHQSTSVEMRDVLSTRVDQRVSERLLRRGFVYLDTVTGLVPLGLVRHPGALCRLIDAERLGENDRTDPFDTIYTYEDPEPIHFDVQPDQWQRRRYE
jgi:membrane protein YdbS with pleckstrin-like domain